MMGQLKSMEKRKGDGKKIRKQFTIPIPGEKNLKPPPKSEPGEYRQPW
jgi:hypothetical protein